MFHPSRQPPAQHQRRCHLSVMIGQRPASHAVGFPCIRCHHTCPRYEGTSLAQLRAIPHRINRIPSLPCGANSPSSMPCFGCAGSLPRPMAGSLTDKRGPANLPTGRQPACCSSAAIQGDDLAVALRPLMSRDHSQNRNGGMRGLDGRPR